MAASTASRPAPLRGAVKGGAGRASTASRPAPLRAARRRAGPSIHSLSVNGKTALPLRVGEADPDLTCPAGAPYDDEVDALVNLAPIAALLAAFAYWIDRQTGRRIDDLKAQNQVTYEQIGKRIDDLKSENRAAHEQLGKRIDDTGKRIDDLKSENRAAHEQLGKRIDDTGKRIDDTGRRIDDLGQRVDKLTDTVNALVPRAAADRRTGP